MGTPWNAAYWTGSTASSTRCSGPTSSIAASSRVASCRPWRGGINLSGLPFTTKQELVDDQLRHPPFGSDLTYPLERYVRVHQTSGTTGRPMYWLDTEASWEWWGECWKAVFEAAGVGPGDRVFFPFSFGPFVGFWSGWEGARKVGALAISGGGQTTQQRLKSLVDYGATVLVCTPTYALHMAAEARRAGMDPARDSAVRVTVHAGEPGASIASTKQRIEEAWGARCFDHTGATEVGAFGFACDALEEGVHVNEDEFIAEVVDAESGVPLPDGCRGELVLTNLGPGREPRDPVPHRRPGGAPPRSLRVRAHLPGAERGGSRACG